jgi:hypothetical protein
MVMHSLHDVTASPPLDYALDHNLTINPAERDARNVELEKQSQMS